MPSNPANEILQSTAEFISSPFNALSGFYRDLADVDDRLHDDSIVVRLICLVTIPFRMLAGLANLMIQNWPTSRSGWAFIVGAPAMLTIAGALGAWILADYVYNEARMINTNSAYYQMNVEQRPESPEFALSYAKKLVEVDPTSEDLKFQLGIAYARAKKLPEAADVMRSLAPDNEVGYPKAHIWRANYLTAGKSLDELRQTMDLAQKQLDLSMATKSDRFLGKYQQALQLMQFANLVDNGSDERFEALVKADEIFREIQGPQNSLATTESEIDFEAPSDEVSDVEGSETENSEEQEKAQDENQATFNIRLQSLRPSTRVRKLLEAIDSEKYDSAGEINRAKRLIENLMPQALRFNADRIQLWALLVNAASETRDTAFTLGIIDRAFEAAKQDETKQALVQLKTVVLRRAAIAINKFPDHDSYHRRLVHLCNATRTMPTDNANYALLLQYVGRENQPPSIQFARANGLSEPGEAVPINLEWLLRSSAELEHSDIINILIGLQQFHEGDIRSAEKSWAVAQQFNPLSRELLIKFCQILALNQNTKLENIETILTKAERTFPESLQFVSARGYYFKSQQKFDLAIIDFRKALSKNPNDIVLHKLIQFCFEYLGKPDAVAAEEQLLQSKLAKMPPEAQSRAIQMLERMEKTESARNGLN